MHFEAPVDPDNGKRGRVCVAALGISVGKGYDTDSPHEVRKLLACPTLVCDRDEAVAEGILTIEEMQALGYYERPAEVRALKVKLGLADDEPLPEKKPEAAAEVAPLPVLPNFATMYRDEVFNFWNDETPDAQARRGTAAIGFSAKIQKARMLKTVRDELAKRGDPRAERV